MKNSIGAKSPKCLAPQSDVTTLAPPPAPSPAPAFVAAPVAPAFRAQARFTAGQWEDIKPRSYLPRCPPGPGKRYVVMVPTLNAGRHATVPQIAARVAHAMGDEDLVSGRVRLAVCVNALDSIREPSGVGLGQRMLEARSSLPERLPVPTTVHFLAWRPTWVRAVDGVPCCIRDVRAHLATHPEARQALLDEEARATRHAPVGFIRTELSKLSASLQSAHVGERVHTVVTDADTELPTHFFARLDALPDEVRVLSGGYRYGAQATPLMHLQNAFDMHIRSHESMDKRLVYLPEPCLAINTSTHHGQPLNFGGLRLESRALLGHLNGVDGIPLNRSDILFDRSLCVTTDAARFHDGRAMPDTFSEFLRILPDHPQSHGRLRNWMHQLADTLNVCVDNVAPMSQLYSVTHIMRAGLACFDDVHSYLQKLDSYFAHQRWMHPPEAQSHEALLHQVVGNFHFGRRPGTRSLALDATRAWAQASLDFLRTMAATDPHVQELYRTHMDQAVDAQPDDSQDVRIGEALEARVAGILSRAKASAVSSSAAGAVRAGDWRMPTAKPYVASPPHVPAIPDDLPGLDAVDAELETPPLAAAAGLSSPASPSAASPASPRAQAMAAARLVMPALGRPPASEAGLDAHQQAVDRELLELLADAHMYGRDLQVPEGRRRTRARAQRYDPYRRW